MDHPDHLRFLRDGVSGSSWAELGSGRGAFTLALADLLGPEGRIYSVDRDPSALRVQQGLMRAQFPETAVTYIQADFSKPLDLPRLDGVLMANSLHFTPREQQANVILQVRGYLKPDGRLALVEYDAARGNTWVPYPLTFKMWQALASECGFVETRLLHRRSARMLSGMYSAVSWNARA